MPSDYYIPYSVDHQLLKGDIAALIDDYKFDKGRFPKLVVLHPCHEKLSTEIPEGINIEYQPCVMSWEIWMAENIKNGGGEVATKQHQTQPDKKFRGDKVKSRDNTASIIMHTKNKAKNKSVHNSTGEQKVKSVHNSSCNKRGPKHRDDLPMEIIKHWAGRGMKLNTIANRLQKEYGVKVHRTTIMRRLQGVLF